MRFRKLERLLAAARLQEALERSQPDCADEEAHYVHKGCDGLVIWDLSGGFCLRCHAESLDADQAGEAGIEAAKRAAREARDKHHGGKP